MKIRSLILSALALILTYTSSMAESKYIISSRLDSTQLLMGRQTTLHLQVVGDLDGKSVLSTIDTMWNKIELVNVGQPEIKDIGNGQKQLTQDVVIQSFEPGLYPVPPFFYAQNGDTAISERPALKVLPVEADSLNNFENVVDVKDNGNLIDTEPSSSLWIWILVAVLLIAAGIFVYFKWIRTGKVSLPILSPKKPIPPYELAIQKLQRLHEEHLCERGAEKIYYTRLIDILRQYLQGRFGINAMEMTSAQILNAITSEAILPEAETDMRTTLATSDFVKFAKVKPTPDENERSYRSVVYFVENTKPITPGSEESGNEVQTDSAQKK